MEGHERAGGIELGVFKVEGGGGGGINVESLWNSLELKLTYFINKIALTIEVLQTSFSRHESLSVAVFSFCWNPVEWPKFDQSDQSDQQMLVSQKVTWITLFKKNIHKIDITWSVEMVLCNLLQSNYA